VTSVSTSFPGAQQAGDLNVVAIGWGDTSSTITSVSDTSGNNYVAAAPANTVPGVLTMAIYYAKNIAASANNTVTINFSSQVPFPDLRALEYSGLDPANPLDVTAAGSGSNAASSTPPVAISYPNELLFAANDVTTGTTSAGPGFTSRVITQPDEDIAEDEIVNLAGIYTATAPLSTPGSWAMQMATFKAAGSAAPVLTVFVNPGSQNVAVQAVQTFVATVTNDPSHKGVTWALSGTGCTGAACGTLTNVTSTYATYIAPPAVPSPATVTLTATSVSDQTQTGTAVITISAINNLTAIAISPTNATIPSNGSQVYAATATYSDNTTGDVTDSVVWSSSATATAAISPLGVATGVTDGTVTITATSGALTSSAPLTVSDVALPVGIGWHVLPAGTALSNSGACPPNYFQGDSFPFATDCQNVIRAWSGAIADTNSNRMLIWGGGHLNYYGNEIYSLNLSQNPVTLTRIKDPTVPTNYSNQANCVEGIPASDPTLAPNSRESYGGLAFIANADAMFTFGGSLACANGWGSYDTWTIPIGSLSNSTLWAFEQLTIQGTPPSMSDPDASPYGPIASYDPNSGLVFVSDGGALFTYDYSTNTYNQITPTGGFSHSIYLMGAVDPVRKLFIALGNCPGGACALGDGVFVADISNPASTTLQDWTAATMADSNCAEFLGGGTSNIDSDAAYPGFVFDPVAEDFVGWPSGGNSIYILTPDTVNQQFTCQKMTFPGGPPNSAHDTNSPNTTHGTYGRFNYFPASDAFVLVNDWNIPAYILRLR
jgi:hypothetical protein